MERSFIWVFDHSTLFFSAVIIAAAAVAYRIGRPRRWFLWTADGVVAGMIVVSAAALIFFSSIRGALNDRIDTIAFTTPGSTAVHPISDYRGKEVVLHLLATWCPPCRKEMPDLSRIADQWQGHDVVVLTISHETWDAIDRYTSRFPLKTTVGRFTSAPPKTSLQAFAWQGRPTTLVLGRDGQVRRQLIGARHSGSFDDAIRAALGVNCSRHRAA